MRGKLLTLFLLMATLAARVGPVSAYEEPMGKLIYRLSDSGEYLLQVWPMFESQQDVPHGIFRESLVLAVYKKQIKSIEGVEEPIVTFEEVSLFRAQLPHNVHSQFAEVQEAMISNDGTRIVLRSIVHPEGATDIPEVFIYDQSGRRVASFSRQDLFGDQSHLMVRPAYSIQLDRRNSYLRVDSSGRPTQSIDLAIGRLLK